MFSTCISRSVGSFLVSYCDSVLKRLPDIKTMISLHQQLMSTLGGVTKGSGQKTNDLDSSDSLRNAGELKC